VRFLFLLILFCQERLQLVDMVEISIITINLNNKKGLETTILSVANQTVNDFEYIIIDGGSTDGSLEVIRDNASIISYWVSETDRGIYHAINKGINKANGRYLIFLNSGDCFYNTQSIENCLKKILSFPDSDIFYGDIRVVNDRNNLKKWYKKYPSNLSVEFFKNDTINHQASLIKKEIFYELGFYPEKYNLASDYWLFLKCVFNNKKFKYLNFTMIDYDLSGVSGLNYKNYKVEMESIWQTVVPAFVTKMLEESIAVQSLLNYRIIRYAIYINSKFQALITFNYKKLLFP